MIAKLKNFFRAKSLMKFNIIDEWSSGDAREDVIGALEQGASKKDDCIIVVVRNRKEVSNIITKLKKILGVVSPSEYVFSPYIFEDRAIKRGLMITKDQMIRFIFEKEIL